MTLSIRTLEGTVIVSVAGTMDSRVAGHLYDTLVDCTREGKSKLVVDLSGVHFAAHAGVRGLIVAAKLMKMAKGEMRICGARPSVEACLRSLCFNDLLRFDPTLAASLARLSGREIRQAEPPAERQRTPRPALPDYPLHDIVMCRRERPYTIDRSKPARGNGL